MTARRFQLSELDGLFAAERQRRVRKMLASVDALVDADDDRARDPTIDELAMDLHALKGMAQLQVRQRNARIAARAEARLERMRGPGTAPSELARLRADIRRLADDA